MKNHYRYFQRQEKSAWIPVAAENAERTALNDGGVRLTVLATSAMLGGIDGTAAPKDLKYHGPLYFDIDHGDDLPLAIAAGNKLVAKLIEEYEMEERDIEIFLSGKKGLHVFIQPHHFNFTRSVLRLPKVYLEMAKHLYVSGMDMQVYSTRNAFRLPNVKRDDGRYRVQVTAKELRELTHERYLELTSEPRNSFRPPMPSNKVYTQLAVLFEQAMEQARKAERPVSDSARVFAPMLRQQFASELPPCIHHLAEGRRAETRSFNEVAVQVAIFAARLTPDGLGTFEPMFTRIADNQSSTSYATPRQRQEHMEGQYNYMRHTDSYEFSCNAMRSVLKTRVCSECPIEATKVVETPEDAARVVALEARPDGYFDTSGKSPRRLSTFRMHPDYVFNETQEDGQVRRMGTVVRVESGGSTVGSILLDETAWTNRSAFLRALGGVGNVSFFGTETDIQKLKFVTMSDPDLPERTLVHEMGLHVTQHEGREVRTYVEKHTSINNMQLSNTMVYEGPEDYDPYLVREKLTIATADDAIALKQLLTLNEMEVMSILVGWTAACHIKPHMVHHFRQFPLVNLWGNAGNGKTTVARYACVLGGADFVSEHEEMNVPLSTPFTWLASLSNSASIPVLWDEVNRSGEKMTPKAYARVMELLKACWNGQAAKKGNINTNRSIGMSTYKLIRPVIYCSEQAPDMPALLDRSLIVLTTEKALHKFDGRDRELRQNLDGLKRCAYTLMLAALATPSSEVAALLNATMDRLPKELRNRPRYSTAVCMTGLAWLGKVMRERGVMDDELEELLAQADKMLLDRAVRVATEEASRQISTEVDKVFAELFEVIDQSQLAASGEPGAGIPLLRRGIHFAVSLVAGQWQLHLDVRSAHTAYLQWANRKRTVVILDELKTFAKLAVQESYVLGVDKQQSILDGRHAFRIDLAEAERRGLPTYLLGDPNDF